MSGSWWMRSGAPARLSSQLGPHWISSSALAGELRVRARDRVVLGQRRGDQLLVVVGPGLVVVVDLRQVGVGEDRQQLLDPPAGLQPQPALAVELPAAAPLLLVLPALGVADAGLGLDVVEPHVLGAGPVGPDLLAGDRAGVAADALVEVHHHPDLRADPHSNLTSASRLRSTVTSSRCEPVGPVVVEAERELRVAADEVGRLHHDPRQRVVGAAALALQLGQRHVQVAVLGVVHQARALGDAVRDRGAAGDDAVAVVGLDPVVVADLERLGVLAADPQHPAAAEQGQHVQVVLVLGVDRPLRVRRQVAQRQLRAGPSRRRRPGRRRSRGDAAAGGTPAAPRRARASTRGRGRSAGGPTACATACRARRWS